MQTVATDDLQVSFPKGIPNFVSFLPGEDLLIPEQADVQRLGLQFSHEDVNDVASGHPPANGVTPLGLKSGLVLRVQHRCILYVDLHCKETRRYGAAGSREFFENLDLLLCRSIKPHAGRRFASLLRIITGRQSEWYPWISQSVKPKL